MGVLKRFKTFDSGDIHCDYCGRWIKNTDGGLIGVMGGDILKRAVAAGTHHFCDSDCKRAWEEENGELASTKAKKRAVAEIKAVGSEMKEHMKDALQPAVDELKAAGSEMKEQMKEQMAPIVEETKKQLKDVFGQALGGMNAGGKGVGFGGFFGKKK